LIILRLGKPGQIARMVVPKFRSLSIVGASTVINSFCLFMCKVIIAALNIDFLVATNRAAIVETIVPVWNRVLLSRRRIQRLPG
jgi:hypothetical protein